MVIKTIDAKTLKQWLFIKKVVLIDVRELDEYQEAHIQGAKLIPLSTIATTQLPELGEKKLVLHCKSGKRSQRSSTKDRRDLWKQAR